MKLDEIFAKDNYRKMLGLIAFTVIFTFGVFNYKKVYDVVETGLGILKPFLIGFAMAFVLNILISFFENRVFKFANKSKLWLKVRRMVCILLSIVLVMTFILAVVLLVVPELRSSTMTLVSAAPIYAEKLTIEAERILEQYDLSSEVTKYLEVNWKEIFSEGTAVIRNFMGSIFTFTVEFTSVIVTFLVALFFAIYLMAGKEKLIRNAKCTLYAFISKKRADRTVEIARVANKIFKSFVSGQCMEALILGSLCFVGMSIFNLPYALLVSVFISITALVPVFGAYIGAVLGCFVIFMVSPAKAAYFLIFILILQQVENNFIYPRVVGGSIGLPGLWVMLAIFVCGDLMGIVGILLGVPTFSLVYTLLKSAVAERLKEKNMSISDFRGGNK